MLQKGVGEQENPVYGDLDYCRLAEVVQDTGSNSDLYGGEEWACDVEMTPRVMN